MREFVFLRHNTCSAKMVVLSYIISFLLLSFMVFLIVKGIVRFIRNDRGWRRMEEDREAKGMPFYGEMEEELEKEMYDIWD